MVAIKLAQEFQRQFKAKYNYYPYSMKTVQEGKWWKHFTNFAESSKLGDREEEFVKELFSSWEEKDKLYPFVLSQQYAKDIEERISGNSEIKEEKLDDTEYIKLTLMRMNFWAAKNFVFVNKMGKFLNDPTCQALALRGMYYKPLFFFSKSFLDKYTLTEEDKLKKDSIRAFHPKIYDALKTSLAENFVD